MFPLHQGDELFFKISSCNYPVPNPNPNPHQHHNIPQDLILYPPLPASLPAATHDLDHMITMGSKSDHTQIHDHNHGNINKTTKKMMHREVERQRRKEMATLHSSLRSLLPLQFIKGKRSISDHTNEAVNYIKHLQMKIKELASKRDELKGLSSINSSIGLKRQVSSSSNSSNQYSSSSSIIIQPCLGGFEIVLSTGLGEEGFPLSRLLRLLLKEGISVVNCVSSTRVNQKLLHTIQAQVNDPTCVNLSHLQQNLDKHVSTSVAEMRYIYNITGHLRESVSVYKDIVPTKRESVPFGIGG